MRGALMVLKKQFSWYTKAYIRRHLELFACASTIFKNKEKFF